MQRILSSKRFPFVLLLFGLLIVLAWFGLKGWRIYQAGTSLLERQTEIETLMTNGFAQVDADEAERLLLGVQADFLVIKEETAVFMPLLPHLGWVPQYGDVLVAAPTLLEMADAGITTAVHSLYGLKPALALLQEDSGGDTLAQLVQIMDQAQPDLAQASRSFEQVVMARGELTDIESLPWTIRQFLPQVDELLPIGQDGLQLSQVLPAMLGAEGERQYLIIAQNEDELRATGGFISGVGLLVVDNGNIVNLSFLDANLVDDYRNKPYDIPPPPLEQYMGLQLFLFRDANYWADFPTSAEALMALYSYGQDVPMVDGVIAVDQAFVEALVQGVGSVPLPELGMTISPNNVRERLAEAWGNQDGTVGNSALDRKAFIGVLAAAIREKIETNPAGLDPVHLIKSLHQAAEERHLQIYVRDAGIAPVFAQLGWDGALAPLSQTDTLMLVETNMGFNKVNALVNNTLQYNVTLASNGTAQAAFQVDVHNPNPATGQPCQHGTVYSANTTYQSLRNDCYWNYARVYVPAGTTLLNAPSPPIAGNFFLTHQGWDGQVTTNSDPSQLTNFADFWLIPQGIQNSRTYQYQLPAVVRTLPSGNQQYQLNLYKQAGTRPYPVTIHVNLPANTTLIATSPSATVNGQTISWQTELNQNLSFFVTYQ